MVSENVSGVIKPDNIRALVDEIGGPEAIVKGVQQHVADAKYFSDNCVRLKAEYPDQSVGILNGEVLGHDRDHEVLVEQMRAQGIDTSIVFFGRTYVKDKPPDYIFVEDV